ncbi:MAG: hypothetical protein HFF26_02945 [Oscillospiraceae bacterium]|nr:hypothetical protein [Oscillospiraceae bacterium]
MQCGFSSSRPLPNIQQRLMQRGIDQAPVAPCAICVFHAAALPSLCR